MKISFFNNWHIGSYHIFSFHLFDFCFGRDYNTMIVVFTLCNLGFSVEYNIN